MAGKEEKKQKFPFKKSMGPSKHPWNNFGIGTLRPVQCGLCGTVLPELGPDDSSYTIGIFLGVQFIEECCGAVVDRLYTEFGGEFTMAFLKEFAENPTDLRFGLLLIVLEEALAKALAITNETGDKITKFSGQLSATKERTKKK